MSTTSHRPFVAIACGGTGGHLFPGLAVAYALSDRDCDVQLILSPKEVDQKAVKSLTRVTVATLPAVGLTRGHRLEFLLGAWRSYRAAKNLFARKRPSAVLAMGGFTSAPPILAGRRLGAATFLHESNTIPGRANRWLARWVDQVFVAFPTAALRLANHAVLQTGTPVRPEFQSSDPALCRAALGLRPLAPTLLIMGGSQGATGLNDLALRALPQMARAHPELQYLHLTGPADVSKAEAAYRTQKASAIVRPFLDAMPQALGAATLSVSRAGGSSLAELASMRLPSILIPYPSAADNHQFFNARAFVDSGAACLLEQAGGTGERLAAMVDSLLTDKAAHDAQVAALARWHNPRAAETIAETMLTIMRSRGLLAAKRPTAEPKSDEPTHLRGSQQPA